MILICSLKLNFKLRTINFSPTLYKVEIITKIYFYSYSISFILAMTESHLEAIEANRNYMDSAFARKYDSMESQKIINSVNVRAIVEFDPLKGAEASNGVADDFVKLPEPNSGLWISLRPLCVLDFAVGTGSVTEQLVPYLQKGSEVVGIDINENLMKLFEERIETLAVSAPEIAFEAVLNDVMKDDTTVFENRFDLIFLTISYHHIHDYESVTKKLALFLKKGGSLVIIDFYNEDVEKTPASGKSPIGAVQHMGGLKLDNLKHTLGEFSGLTNVSANCFGKVKVWMAELFILNHSTQDTIDALEKGLLPLKKGPDGSELFEVVVSMVMAVGTRE